MRVAVTGAAGFIGSHLVQACSAQGWDTAGIDCMRPYYDVTVKRANLERQAGLANYRFHEIDLSDPGADLASLLRGADAVFHQAAQPGVRESWRDGFAGYARDNVLATQRLLEACVAGGVPRFVYASSSSIYGDADAYPVLESALPRPVSPYGVTKLAGEHLATAYAANFGLEVVILRYFTVYGPGQRPDMATHRLIDAALYGRPFPLFGTGEQIRDFTFVADVVTANLQAARITLAGPAVVNIGGGTSISLNHLIGLVESETGAPVRLDRSGVQAGDVRRTGADTAAAADLLGWRPAVPIEEGVRRQVEWQKSRAAAVGP